MSESVLALVIATAAMLGSPGPATLSLAAVGATTGFARGLPYLAGILAGLWVVMVGSVTGLATVLSHWPVLRSGIQVLGVAWILFIAWKIATAPAADPDKNRTAPNARDGFVLNLLNPKAYAAFLALFSQFVLPVSDDIATAYAATAAVCFIVAIAVDSAWLAVGSVMQSLFRAPQSARIVRIVFALSIVAATLWVVWIGQLERVR